jgi:hypothetical protein
MRQGMDYGNVYNVAIQYIDTSRHDNLVSLQSFLLSHFLIFRNNRPQSLRVIRTHSDLHGHEPFL